MPLLFFITHFIITLLHYYIITLLHYYYVSHFVEFYDDRTNESHRGQRGTPLKSICTNRRYTVWYNNRDQRGATVESAFIDRREGVW